MLDNTEPMLNKSEHGYELQRLTNRKTFDAAIDNGRQSTEAAAPKNQIIFFFDQNAVVLHYFIRGGAYPSYEGHASNMGAAELRYRLQRQLALAADQKCSPDQLKCIITSHAEEHLSLGFMFGFAVTSFAVSLIDGLVASLVLSLPFHSFAIMTSIGVALLVIALYNLQDLSDLSRWGLIGTELLTIVGTGGIGAALGGIVGLALQAALPTLLSTAGLSLGWVVCIGAGVGLLVSAGILAAAAYHYNQASNEEKVTIIKQLSDVAPVNVEQKDDEPLLYDEALLEVEEPLDLDGPNVTNLNPTARM